MEVETPKKIIKFEWLTTYECNLACQGCKVIKMGDVIKPKPFDIKKYEEGLDNLYYFADANFGAFYGAEPTMLGKKNLGDLVELLTKYSKDGKTNTIITNGVILNGDHDYQQYLLDRGMDSITCSVDVIGTDDYDVSSTRKSHTGLELLDSMKQKGIRDTCGVVTMTGANLQYIPDVVQEIHDRGHWVGFDVLHYDQKNGNDMFSSGPSKLSDIMLSRLDRSQIAEVADRLIEMKSNGVRLFPPVSYFEMLKNPKYSVDLNWKCGDGDFPHCITVSPDYRLHPCDCQIGKYTNDFTVFDLPKRWDEYVEAHFKSSAECESGCFWSTHFLACEMVKDYTKDKSDYYSHKEKNGK